LVHSTKGIVLRTVKYGETSVIVLILTEKFGIQSYLVNGVRTVSKKGSGNSGYFQPAAILDLEVYHNELKQLNRLKEFRWALVYKSVFSDVMKNAVAMFMVELLTRCLKQPEVNSALFQFAEDSFVHLDESEAAVAANMPLFFALHLAGILGFRIHAPVRIEEPFFLDLQEGQFTIHRPSHSNYLEGRLAASAAQILQAQQPPELRHVKLNQDTRRELLHAIENYYALQVHEFGKLKTVPVLEAILS
jgi:DNA repair protein RecO (recombination protein O)